MTGRVRSALVDRALPLAMVLGLVLRLALVPLAEGEARFGTTDWRAHRRFAAELPSALWSPDDAIVDITLERGPGYPVLLLVMDADDGPVRQVVWVQALIGGVVTVALAHLLARRVAGRRAAAVAAFVVAVDPASVAHAAQLMPETLFAAVALAGVVLVWTAARTSADAVRWRRAGWALLAGATLGLAALVRPQATPLVAVAAIGAGLLALPWGRRRALAVGALVAAGALLVLGPWLVRNGVVADRWLVSASQTRGVVTSVARAPTVLGPAEGLLFRLAGGDPSPPARVGIRTAALVALGAELALAAAGIAALARRRAWAVLGLLVVPVAAYLVLAAGPLGDVRSRVPVVPYLAVLVGIGAASLRDRRPTKGV